MTEDEMKKTWCPFVRALNGDIRDDGTSAHPDGQTAYNRIVDGAKWAWPVGGCCIGAACSAWRWVMEVEPEGEPPSIAWVKKPGPASHGYCGLAGKP